jgi:branched-subunit amino acid ABC-type transport system permease component
MLDRTAASLQEVETRALGIPTRKILALSWGLAAFLGVLAGLFPALPPD